MGFLIKAHAGNELLVALEAVREGRQFVSSGLSLRPPSVFARDEGAITQQ
jgi:hypothetical protein